MSRSPEFRFFPAPFEQLYRLRRTFGTIVAFVIIAAMLFSAQYLDERGIAEPWCIYDPTDLYPLSVSRDTHR
jgi:hypothetical protein